MVYGHDRRQFVPDNLTAGCWNYGSNSQLLSVVNHAQHVIDKKSENGHR